MKNSQEIVHSSNSDLQYMKIGSLQIMFLFEEMEKLPCLVLSILAVSFKKTLLF